MICFCCGAEYDETAREPVIDMIAMPDGDEPETAKEIDVIHTKSVRFGGKVLKLCPTCTRACAIGIAITSDNLSLIEEVEYEEDT